MSTLDGSSGSRIREMVCVLLLLVQCVVGVLARGEIPRPGGWRGQRRPRARVPRVAARPPKLVLLLLARIRSYGIDL